MRPICVKCQAEMPVKTTGVVLSRMYRGGKIYKQYMADLFECPICRAQVLSGFGDRPIWAQWFHTDPEPTEFYSYSPEELPGREKDGE